MDKTMKIAVLLTAYDKLSSIVNSAANKSQSRLKRLSTSINSFGNGALLAGGIGTAFFASTVKAAEENEVAVNRVRQVFKSMGQDYKSATAMSEAYASKLEMQIGVEDEVIMAVQAKMATFANAANAQARANGIFQRATAATFDMQAAGFGDATQNAVQLGKALQDPIKGITALRRSGITFTAAEQQKIKSLVQSGRLFEAQNTIMKAIEKQVGGVAKSTATSSAKMKVAWSEVTETIGKKLMPAFTKLANWVMQVIPKVQEFIDKHPQLVKWLAISTVGLLGLGLVAKILAPAFSILNGVWSLSAVAIKLFGWQVSTTNKLLMTTGIMLIITAIAIAAYLIIKNWSSISAFFSRLWNSVVYAFKAAWNFIKSIFIKYTPVGLIVKNWSKIKAFFTGLWNGVKNIFRNVWNGIKTFMMKYTPFGLIMKNWSKIKGFFSNLWQGVKNIFVGVWKFIKNIGKQMWEAGKNIIMSIWNGIKSMINKPIELIKSMVKKIRRFLPFSPAKEGPLKDIHKIKLVETIAATINAKPIEAAMRRVTGAVVNPSSPVAVIGRSGGGVMHVSFSPTYHINGGDKNDIMEMMKKRDRELLKTIEEAQRRRDRTKF